MKEFTSCVLKYVFKQVKFAMLTFYVSPHNFLLKASKAHHPPLVHFISATIVNKASVFICLYTKTTFSATAASTYSQQTHIMIKVNFVPYRAQNKVLAHVKWPVWNSKCILICSQINTCRKTAIHGRQIIAWTVSENDGGVLEETALCSNYFWKCHHHYSFISLHVCDERHREMVISGSHFSEGILLQPLPLPRRSILKASGWLCGGLGNFAGFSCVGG